MPHLIFLLSAVLDGTVLEPSWRFDLAVEGISRARVLAVSSDGTAVAIDRFNGRLAFIDARGSLVASVHVPGEGPGELAAPGEIAWSEVDDAFAILDYGTNRISYWRADGRHIEERRFSGILFNPRFHGRDAIYCGQNPGGMNGEPGLVRFDIGKGETEVLHQLPKPDHPWSKAGDGANTFTMLYGWDPMLHFDLGGDFIAVAFGDDERVSFLDFDGVRMGRSLPIGLPSRPVTDAQIEASIANMPRSMHAGMRRGLVQPELWPALRGLFVDEADRIYLIGAAVDVGRPVPFRVIERNGSVVLEGEIEGHPMAVADEAMYYYASGDDSFELIRADLAFSK